MYKKESLQASIQKKKNHPSQNRFVTLTLRHASLTAGRQHIPLVFVRENGLRLGLITMLSKDGTKWMVKLVRNGRFMSLGRGWKDFVVANGLKIGESFTLECILENATPILSLLSTESSTRQQGECSKELSSGDKTRKAKNNKENKRDDLSLPSQNRFVSLTPTHASLTRGIQVLPHQFVTENGLRSGVIILVGKDGTKWPVNLVRRTERVLTLGGGWKDFAVANGLKTGESFTFEFISENATPVLILLSAESAKRLERRGKMIRLRQTKPDWCWRL